MSKVGLVAEPLKTIAEMVNESQTAEQETDLIHTSRPGPKVIKLCSCSTQLSIKFILLINVKMPTFVGILTFISRINDWLC